MRPYVTILCALLLLSSCTKAERDAMYTSQESKIEAFVKKELETNPDARVIYNGGSVRVVIGEGEGMELTARGKAGIYYAGYDFSKGSISTSTMFVTNYYSFAMSSGWTLSDEESYQLLEIDLTDKSLLDGLRSGLEGVREKEECYILFSGKHGFGKDGIGTISANAPLAFHVWVQTVEN